MSVDRFRRQFDEMTKGVNQVMLGHICECLIAEHRRSESGYGRRVDLSQIGGEKIESWMYSGFCGTGIGTRGRIAYVEKIVQAGQENSVK
jgi:hypothetical protein